MEDFWYKRNSVCGVSDSRWAFGPHPLKWSEGGAGKGALYNGQLDHVIPSSAKNLAFKYNLRLFVWHCITDIYDLL